MRKAAICTMLALTALVASCGTEGANPTAVEANTIAPSAGSSDTPDTTGTTGARPATTDPDTGGTRPARSPADFTITWGKARDGLQSGTIEVPIDYADPSQGTFTLALVRHLARDEDERIGTLLVNPGGPGFSGLPLAEQAELIYGEDLVDRFDILAWDPRGTGASRPAIDCYDDYDQYFNSTDITPDSPEEQQQSVDLAEDATADCVTKNPKILQHVGTNDSAHDMDAIRQALGEDQISFFGFSYGSELGGTWATLFPDTVRAAVFDGAANPDEDPDASSISQMKGFEAALDTFLAQCSADSKCAFHNDGDAEGAFDAVMAKLDENPLPALKGRPDLTLGAALSGVIEAMYSDTSWPTLAKALRSAQQGNGSGLMQLYDQYYQRRSDGSYDNSLEAFTVISCIDQGERATVEEADALAVRVHAVAPRLSPGTVGGYMCTFFPASDDPRIVITGAGAGPIVVIGTTGDPSTPLVSSRAMAAALEGGVLVIVQADQHTGYNVNDCVNQAVDDYLVDPTDVPADGLECK